MRTTAQYGPA